MIPTYHATQDALAQELAHAEPAWWADKRVQKDRDAFNRIVKLREPIRQAKAKEVARYVPMTEHWGSGALISSRRGPLGL